MSKKMTENERFLSKEINRLRKENDNLKNEIFSLQDKIYDLQEEVLKANPVREQIKDITKDEALREIKLVLKRYGL